MKLRNKRTGFVTDWCIDKDIIRTCDGSIKYHSLAELYKDWEDYEGPKVYWCIDWASLGVGDMKYVNDNVDKFNISIGNYFETEEEAEEAVEKLKAWKRLKDAGFFIYGYAQVVDNKFNLFARSAYDDIKEDLDLLFGGER